MHTFCFYLYTLKNRLSYIVYALERLLECSQQYKTVGILYDVACTLQKHLKVSLHAYELMHTFLLWECYRIKEGLIYLDSLS